MNVVGVCLQICNATVTERHPWIDIANALLHEISHVLVACCDNHAIHHIEVLELIFATLDTVLPFILKKSVHIDYFDVK